MRDDQEKMRELQELRDQAGEQAREAHEQADAAHERAEEAIDRAAGADRTAEKADETLVEVDGIIADREGRPDEVAARRRRRRGGGGGGFTWTAIAGTAATVGEFRDTVRDSPAAIVLARAAVAATTTVVVAFPGGVEQRPPIAGQQPRASIPVSQPSFRPESVPQQRPELSAGRPHGQRRGEQGRPQQHHALASIKPRPGDSGRAVRVAATSNAAPEERHRVRKVLRVRPIVAKLLWRR